MTSRLRTGRRRPARGSRSAPGPRNRWHARRRAGPPPCACLCLPPTRTRSFPPGIRGARSSSRSSRRPESLTFAAPAPRAPVIRLPYRSPSPACPSGPSTSSSTAASTTVPALSVLPGAIVSRRFALNAKSPASAGDTANAETVTVTSSAVTRLSCAVTRLSPPSSEICSGANTRVTVGAPSSSVIVSVCGSGASRPAAPVAVALTRARRFGSSTSLSTAVTVTRPVLSVLPAAIVSSPVRAQREVVRVRRRHRRRRDGHRHVPGRRPAQLRRHPALATVLRDPFRGQRQRHGRRRGVCLRRSSASSRPG